MDGELTDVFEVVAEEEEGSLKAAVRTRVGN